MSDSAPVSFTVRRPSPISRPSSSGFESDESSFKIPVLPRHLSSSTAGGSPLARSGANSPQPKTHSRTYHERDSSDEEDEPTDELVTGFDQFGVQRLHERKKPEGPLVIAPLQNKDWRETARKRRTSERFIPGAGNVGTGADGSVGGLGTRDSINSGPQLVGLQLGPKRVKLEHDTATMEVDSSPATPANEPAKEEPEDEDKRALRALLAGDEENVELPAIPVILSRTLSEAEALKQDVEELPDSANLDDYERVPVAQFGAAMLRGMGWTEDKAASRNGKSAKGNVQPWIPEQRPALLGIGAKEREILDDGDPKKKKRGKQDLRYVPLLKKEKDDSTKSDAEGSGRGSSRNDRHEDDERSYERSRSEREPKGSHSDRDYRDRDYKSEGRSRGERSRDDSPQGRRLDNRNDRERRSGYDYDDRRRDDRRRDERRERDRDHDRRREERDSGRESSRRRERDYR